MSEIVRKKVCKCEHCGNEAEMIVTCSLSDEAEKPADASVAAREAPSAAAHQVKGTAVCSHCGNEADMWIDL
jgi:DNA-directed RNA polymerase subunit M/transcription elongation factor TFIIS